MNEKLKGILHTAWNEPRHFFLWLALVSAGGFAAVWAGTGQSGPTRLPAVVAVGCIVCFLASILAFILALLPPVRRLFSWLLQRRFLALGCIVTLVALFYAIENWRGRRAWQVYRRGWEAKGERFDLRDLFPPPAPKDENFFETPLWNDLHFVQTNNSIVWSDTNWGNRVIFDAFGPKGGNSPSTGNWAKAQRVDLVQWQAFYRGSNNLFSARNGPPTNYFPVAKEPLAPAADVLRALSKFNENRQLLIAAAARPHARFWLNYEAGPATLLPHLARIKSASQYLSLHANAALKAGDKQSALEDIMLQFRLLDSIRGEPDLISHLVRIAVQAIALEPVWEGLADRQWSQGDLSLIEGELGKLDFLADYQFAMRGERGCGLWVADYVGKAGFVGLEELFDPDRKGPGPGELEKFLGMAMFRLIPAGWFDQNKLSLCLMFERYMLPVVDRERRIVSPALVEQSQAAIARQSCRPYDAISKRLMPALGRSGERFAYAQTSADLARLACALERYRLANGQFPETLEPLEPKFIENLPRDVINGQPLKYRRTEGGQFVLYSVGWNQTDDGGKIELRQGNRSVDITQGDWVWRYPGG